ncbi:MAG: acyltransferase [Desulfobacterales bacterium]|nr:acyltransferase [Desulfobacterales bacterium]
MTLLDHGRAVISLLLVALNTLFWGVPVYLLTLVKLVFRGASQQEVLARALMRTVNFWIYGNLWIQRVMLGIQWDIQGTEGLRMDEWYFVNCNHQSWADLPILLEVFTGRIPFPKIFTKQELIWLPIIGQALWAMDYPFMRRYSREERRRHPEIAGRDREAARRACRKYRHTPVAILNFPEGTRFTAAKHRQQASPYRHLLPPRAGGLAYALEALEGRIRCLLDVTIIYPQGETSFWAYIGGQVKRIVVRVRPIEVPARFLEGDYHADPEFRAAFQSWLGALWRQKDDLLERHLKQDAHLPREP